MDDCTSASSIRALTAEVNRLKARVAELESTLAAEASTAEGQRDLGRDLRERVKELNCLLSIARLRDVPGATTQTMLQGIVDLIPPAWQYPEATHARIIMDGFFCCTRGFQSTAWNLTQDVTLQDERIGVVEVHYVREMPMRDIGPFLTEERNLLEAIAERISRIVEQERAEEKARQQQQQMVQLDKMVALGTLVSGVAHEINNPNNFVMLNAPILAEVFEHVQPVLDRYVDEHGDFMVSGLPYSEMREEIPSLFAGILEGARRISAIVQNLKGFARAETTGYRERLDLNEVVRAALVLLRNQIKHATRNFVVALDEDLPAVKGNRQRLEQVVINLVQNACESLPDPSAGVTLSTSSDESRVRLLVTDEGCGIAPGELPRIADPFFTTKRDQGGTGLGLSVSMGIVKEHQGNLTFVSRPGEGTTATLSLPICRVEPDTEEVPA